MMEMNDKHVLVICGICINAGPSQWGRALSEACSMVVSQLAPHALCGVLSEAWSSWVQDKKINNLKKVV